MKNTRIQETVEEYKYPGEVLIKRGKVERREESRAAIGRKYNGLRERVLTRTSMFVAKCVSSVILKC